MEGRYHSQIHHQLGSMWKQQNGELMRRTIPSMICHKSFLPFENISKGLNCMKTCTSRAAWRYPKSSLVSLAMTACVWCWATSTSAGTQAQSPTNKHKQLLEDVSPPY